MQNLLTCSKNELNRKYLVVKTGKVAMYQEEQCFYIFFNGSPVNFYYDLEKAIEHYNRLVKEFEN